jgi:hypothetical protein
MISRRMLRVGDDRVSGAGQMVEHGAGEANARPLNRAVLALAGMAMNSGRGVACYALNERAHCGSCLPSTAAFQHKG